MNLANLNLTRGQRYWLRYRSEAQRLDRTAVMTYLGSDGNGGKLMFSARPAAGTQAMPRSWLLEVRLVSPNAPIYMNRIVR